ncbi:MAG: hypothetical protein ACR2Q3_00530 [Woeseiaceae bacterium]
MCTLLVLLALCSACVATRNAQQIDSLDSIAENPRVIMMPPDIRYYLLTTGGLPQPHREWTETARDNFSNAARDFAGSIGADMRILDPTNIGLAETEYDRLHNAVGLTILNHHFGASRLPGKNDGQVFDWSLGPGVSVLAEKHDADYALFVYYRDYQASGGRVAFSIFAAALGSYVATGAEQGFASLVDLRTGNVVWFNVVGDGSGELRDASGAAAAVRTLFKDIPAARQDGTLE